MPSLKPIMYLRRPIFRPLFFLFLLACLLTGLVGVVDNSVPVKAASSNIVISQVYGGGGNSGATYTNDYVELFNLGSMPQSLSGWSIQYASATSTSWAATNLSGSIAPGQYYLVQLAGGASGSALPTPDLTGSLNLSSTDGKVALVNSTTALTGSGCPFSASVIDFVGYGSADCSEAVTAPAPSNTTADIRFDICRDTDNNSVEFVANPTSPHNSATLPVPCLRVINIDSSSAAPLPTTNTYISGTNITITVTFSNLVTVDLTNGSPTLALETGTADTKATYMGGSGTSTLTFNYLVVAGDTSGDLDYVAVNSLALNGSTITGAAGNASLTLPPPGTGVLGAGSLGVNKDIRIDNGNGVAPSILSFARQPASSLPTRADSLVFRVTFNEAVIGVDTGDFVVTGTTATPPTSIVLVSSGIYDVTVSGGNLNNLNGTVGLNLSVAQNITDAVLTPLPNSEPPIDETYTVDNTSPTVTIDQATGQLDPTSVTPINFDVVFSEDIDVSTFTAADISLSGTSTFATWGIVDSGNHRNFTISATSISPNGTVIPRIVANRVSDLAGNLNAVNSTAVTDGSVTFGDTTAPTVTINQASGQADPTASFPVNFTVVFSEPISSSIFTSSDITQNGTATGVSWSVTNSGDNRTFTVSATSSTGTGTIQPSIAANRVTDLVGNNNSASTSTDNTVVYETTRPSVTVNQAIGQADPTSALPINFTVIFTEPINTSTFIVADITQAGTATGITWVITDSGDHRTFTLSATNLGTKGTLIPAIGVNKVTDLAGNNNLASTSTDNSVTSTVVLPTPTRTPTRTPTTTPTLGVIISEVAWMGTSSSNSSDEWVELYNGGSTVVDLSDWTLESTDGTIDITFLSTDPSHTINPGAFFILAKAGTFTDVTINKTITASFSDSGKSLELRNSAGVLIDTANSNGGVWPAGKNSSTYPTMERHAGTTLDIDANWYTFAGTPTTHARDGIKLVYGTPGYANWAASVTATPSPIPTGTRAPTKTPTLAPPPPPPLIAINEFVPRPGHDWNNDGVVNTGDEYIEILNHGVIDVNLSGYKLDDEANVGSQTFNLPSVTLKPGERIVFYGKETGLLLGDGGDGVRLLKSNGQLMDAYNYSVVDFPDQSYCRLPDNGGADDWNTNCYPTPGLQNSLSGTVLRPPTQNDEDNPLCPIADTLPQEFVLAECSPFGNNIWSRYYWDKFGWYGEKSLPNVNGKWDVYAD